MDAVIRVYLAINISYTMYAAVVKYTTFVTACTRALIAAQTTKLGTNFKGNADVAAKRFRLSEYLLKNFVALKINCVNNELSE